MIGSVKDRAKAKIANLNKLVNDHNLLSVNLGFFKLLASFMPLAH